jgi:D-alanyl-D-alanine carboxypeptidase
MDRWLQAALQYIPHYIDHQMRQSEQPGCQLAVAHKGKVVLQHAVGHANLRTGTALTTKHRFRVASHSKTFTAAAVLKLREQGRLRLDDALGQHVTGLHRDIAKVTLAQLLSHGGGIVRDGPDAGQWSDRHPFLNETQLRADLSTGPVLPANTRFKYSNHGFGLLGLAIQAVTGEPYGAWVAREIIAASGLSNTTPDISKVTLPLLAHGHSGKWPLGARAVIPGDNPTHALASATGFVSTASDLALFFGSLSPDAKKSVLSVASRREMWHRLWRDPHASLERWYGLGSISGTLDDWLWWGHTGGFQGTITRTACVPAQDLTISVLTNASDGVSHVWVDAALHILRTFAKRGAASRRTAAWSGRWWSQAGALDLLPVDGCVLVANPGLPNPMLDAPELTISSPTQGLISLATGFASHGEPVRMERDARGKATAFWLGGTRYQSEAKVAKAMAVKYRTARA